MTAQRYPEYFDGIVAGAPAFNLTHAAIAEAWNTDQLASIAPKKPDGTPDLSQSLTEPDLKLLVHSVLEKCDALDGSKDGLIFNPEACKYDPSVLQCGSSQDSGCLSAEKVKVIDNIFRGPHASDGKAIYSAWPYDSGDATEGWRVWMTGLGPGPSINVLIFPPFFNGVALAGAAPRVDIFKFNFDSDSARIDKASAEINATSTDWTAFRRRKGKLLLYNGMSDPVFSGLDLIRYYKQVEQSNGGEKDTQDFARLFLVPGMNHCGGGPALDDFDTLGPIQAWVEEGKAPDRLVSSGLAFPAVPARCAPTQRSRNMTVKGTQTMRPASPANYLRTGWASEEFVALGSGVFSGITSIPTSNDRCRGSDTFWHLRNRVGPDDIGQGSETVP